MGLFLWYDRYIERLANKLKNSLNKTIQGVNLGGWLLVERWMTPSLFEGTDAEDEYSLSQLNGGADRLRRHHKTFITEADWQWLADHGITHVRLPIGYWALDGDAPYISVRKTLDWAFKMADLYGVKILLDVHALKGSQNGTIHSGRQGAVNWQAHIPDNLEALRNIARRYRDQPALWGIEIINEPKVLGNYFALLRYYRQAYHMLRKELRAGTYTVFQDGFVPPLFAGALWPRKDYPVIMDTHFYLLPTQFLHKASPKKYDGLRTALYSFLLVTARIRQPVIVGEWSSILPQPQFNAVPHSQHMQLLAGTIIRQRKAYRSALATFYWNYKTEGSGMYNYRSLVDDEVI